MESASRLNEELSRDVPVVDKDTEDFHVHETVNERG